MSEKEIVTGDLYGYPYVECSVEQGLLILKKISEKLDFSSEDLNDSIRILNSYEEFYSYARRKGKEFIVPSKRESDFIKGRVVVDKIKPIDKDRVMIIFERRVNRDLLNEVISEIKNL